MKRVLGLEHPDALASMNGLALVYLGQERLGEAEKLFVQVIERRKALLGPEHPDTLTGMHNMLRLYLCFGIVFNSTT